MAIGSLTRHSHQLIAHHQSPRSSSRFVVPPGSPSCRPAWLIGASARSVQSSCRPVVLFAFRFSIVLPFPPVKTCPIHGGGLAAKIGNEGRGGAFSMRRFPQLIIVRPVIRFSSSGAASDRFRPPSLWFRLVPHHLIRLIHLTRPIAPVPSWMAKGVRYFVQASNGAMASIPSWSISSRLIISSHHHHGASRPSSRLMRLGRASRTIYPGHQQGVSDGRSKQTNKKTGTGKRDEKTGNMTGRWQNEHNKTTEKETERERAASKAEATRICGNHEQE